MAGDNETKPDTGAQGDIPHTEVPATEADTPITPAEEIDRERISRQREEEEEDKKLRVDQARRMIARTPPEKPKIVPLTRPGESAPQSEPTDIPSFLKPGKTAQPSPTEGPNAIQSAIRKTLKFLGFK